MAGAVMAWRGVVNSARTLPVPCRLSVGWILARRSRCPSRCRWSAGRTTKISGGWRGSNSKFKSKPFVVRWSGFYRAWAAGMSVLARKYRAGGYFAPFPVWMSGLMKLSVRERDFSQLSRVESGCRRGWRISGSPVVIVARGSMLQNNGGAVFGCGVEWCNPSYTLFHASKNEETRTGAAFSDRRIRTIGDSGNQNDLLS